MANGSQRPREGDQDDHYERFDHGNTRGDPRTHRRPGEARVDVHTENYTGLVISLFIAIVAAVLLWMFFLTPITPLIPNTGTTTPAATAPTQITPAALPNVPLE